MDKFTLTDWAQIISAVGTMMAAIVAVVAAIQSYRSARQSNETNEQMAEVLLEILHSTLLVTQYLWNIQMEPRKH